MICIQTGTEVQERHKRGDKIHSGPYLGRVNKVEGDLGLKSGSGTFSPGTGHLPCFFLCEMLTIINWREGGESEVTLIKHLSGGLV